jgi:hypothetical protein
MYILGKVTEKKQEEQIIGIKQTITILKRSCIGTSNNITYLERYEKERNYKQEIRREREREREKKVGGW